MRRLPRTNTGSPGEVRSEFRFPMLPTLSPARLLWPQSSRAVVRCAAYRSRREAIAPGAPLTRSLGRSRSALWRCLLRAKHRSGRPSVAISLGSGRPVAVCTGAATAPPALWQSRERHPAPAGRVPIQWIRALCWAPPLGIGPAVIAWRRCITRRIGDDVTAFVQEQSRRERQSTRLLLVHSGSPVEIVARLPFCLEAEARPPMVVSSRHCPDSSIAAVGRPK